MHNTSKSAPNKLAIFRDMSIESSLGKFAKRTFSDASVGAASTFLESSVLAPSDCSQSSFRWSSGSRTFSARSGGGLVGVGTSDPPAAKNGIKTRSPSEDDTFARRSATGDEDSVTFLSGERGT